MDRIRFFACLTAVVVFCACSQRTSTTQQVEAPLAAATVEAPAIDPFDPVRSMLGKTCAPCHNPGGKMYERLPFDNPEVIRANQTGIVGRLSGENKIILEKWLQTGSK